MGIKIQPKATRKQVVVHLVPEAVAKIEAVAKSKGISKSEVVNQILLQADIEGGQ